MNPINPTLAIEAPTTVTVTATDDRNQVITWNAVADATGYEVLQATTQNGPFQTIADTVATSYTVTNLNPNTTYYYIVRAYNDNAERAESTVVAAATPATGQPATVNVTPTTTTAALNWTAVAGATVYRIGASDTEDGVYNVIARINAPTTTYTITGLTPDTTRYYKILAYTGTTLTSTSNPVAVTTLADPVNPPTGLSATAEGPTTITVTWTNPQGPIDGVRVYRALNETGPYTLVASTPEATYTDGDLQARTTYYYEVEAYSGNTASVRIGPVGATTTAQIENQLYAYAMENRCVQLIWILNTEPDTVTIERSSLIDGPYTVLGTVDGTTDTYQDCTARHGYIYYYRITYPGSTAATTVGPIRVRVPSDPIIIAPTPLCMPAAPVSTLCCPVRRNCYCNPCNNNWTFF